MQINFQVLETTKKFLIKETTLHKQQNSNHRSNGVKITSFSKRGRIKLPYTCEKFLHGWYSITFITPLIFFKLKFEYKKFEFLVRASVS